MQFRHTAAVLLVVALAACAGDSDDAGETTPPTDQGTPSIVTPSTEVSPMTNPAAAQAPSPSDRSNVSPPTVPRPTGLIHGTVERACSANSDAGGGCADAPVAGAEIELRSLDGGAVGVTRTDQAGVFEFRVPAGRYVIRETSTGGSQQRDVIEGRTTFVGLTTQTR